MGHLSQEFKLLIFPFCIGLTIYIQDSSAITCRSQAHKGKLSVLVDMNDCCGQDANPASPESVKFHCLTLLVYCLVFHKFS